MDPRGVSDPGEIGGTGASRIRTLLPLARGTIFAVVCVMAAMTSLAALGVNIGPLLAGAGVVGLAVGFGAQTLVRDIISGAFYLMDDAFRLGEYIDVGDAKGTVEKIGIRSMQLRHHRGPVNIVPYGAIRRMTNQSRDWVVEKLEFRLTYDTDIAKVKKIIKRIGQELAAHPEMGPHILQPLKSQGVLAMEDSAMLVKAKFTAKPGEQFVILREAYQRIKQAFDEAGIHFAHRQVTVFVPPGTPPAAAAAMAAGAAAAGPVEPREGRPVKGANRCDGGPVPDRRRPPVQRPGSAPVDGDLRPRRAGVPPRARRLAAPAGARGRSASRRWPGPRPSRRACVGRVSIGELFESYAMKSEPVEEAREMGGLLIVAAWMAVLALRGIRPAR